MNAVSIIDVSEWQGVIGWAKVRLAGIMGALIRAGYGDTLSYPNQIDKQFERNYAECKRVGMPVGVYYYCYATTVEQAQREAYGCLALLKGKQFEYPVFYDVEELDTFRSGKTNEIIKAFADILEAAGYWVGVYIYRSAAQSYLTERTRTRYTMAVADYVTDDIFAVYKDPVGIWQDSSTWRVDGIVGNVDHDYCYVDYPKLIKERGKNGYPKPAPKLMYQTLRETPIVQFEGTEPAGRTVQVLGRKTVCGVQYGRVTDNGWISLKDAKQV